ncbi:hypothetical protein KJS94_03660 [Flavihumibacter rivuli]|uniref:hypothetical protein n=1 Tax=Flavihumibacter rivuli TaxID=2838156 RepID=UPI001BDECB97|nr:hypothetical protein [Flavihumibacter rivuli]ULQ57296.1 hypothetical protein KJS94_03660 [Flavihumibacter rivuli]
MIFFRIKPVSVCALLIGFFSVVLLSPDAFSQDTTVFVDSKSITLREVVVRSNMDVPSFIRRVQLDTSFYKSFKNLRVLGYTSLNDIRMLGKQSQLQASMKSRTRQYYRNGCRTMEVLEESITGDMKDRSGDWNYSTAEMYAGLFFTEGMVCGETNTVAGAERKVKDKRGMAKHKEQLKMLFFDPGRKIPGIPFIGEKINIYEPPMADLYDFEIDMAPYKGQNCYVFRIRSKDGLRGAEQDKVVINSVTTYFDQQSMQITARQYDLSYNAVAYDFDVQMEVEIGQHSGLQVPVLVRYTGNWKIAFKKRERGVFTATFFGFE